MNYIIVVVALVLVAGFYAFGMQMQHGEILPADVMKERFELTAENRAVIAIDPSRVPVELHDLIPFAETWGIGDDILRGDFEEQATEEQKQDFRTALTGRTHSVNAWLDTLDEDAMTDDAGHFMYMLGALDEMGLWPHE